MDTINDVLKKSNINEVLDEIDKTKIRDIAIVYRDDTGAICSRWVGDSLALIAMIDFLKEDMRSEVCPCESDD